MTSQTYCVGGAVRDELLGRPASDRDWVVVGSTPAAMESAGFKPVGRHFPVFLHPETKEEYALARTERKTGAGYHGFCVDFEPDVTLEADLGRRDLTINAMARDSHGTLIDPFGGQADLEARVLRHVSRAFAEDPVRVLRVARYAATLAPLGFRIAPETRELMASLAANGEIDALTPERVWAETRRALITNEPAVFFHVLRRAKALPILFPELSALFGVPQPPRCHPEIDTGIHTLLVLDQTARENAPLECRFAALCHDFGKAGTSADEPPAHTEETAGESSVLTLAKRLGVPKRTREFAVLAARWHTVLNHIQTSTATTVFRLFEAIGALRDPARLDALIFVARADLRGRLGFEKQQYPQAEYAMRLLQAARSVDTQAAAQNDLSGPAIGRAIREARITAIDEVLSGAIQTAAD